MSSDDLPHGVRVGAVVKHGLDVVADVVLCAQRPGAVDELLKQLHLVLHLRTAPLRHNLGVPADHDGLHGREGGPETMLIRAKHFFIATVA
jgi:hypothetical protein